MHRLLVAPMEKIMQMVTSPPLHGFTNYIKTGGCKYKYKAYKHWHEGLLDTEPTPEQ